VLQLVKEYMLVSCMVWWRMCRTALWIRFVRL